MTSANWRGKPVPDEVRRERVKAFWNGMTFSEFARKFKLTLTGISSQSYNLGFRRSMKGTRPITHGPCVKCFDILPAKELDSTFQCPACISLSLPEPEPEIGLTLNQERALSKGREIERKAGLRPHLGQPRTPTRKILKGDKLA